MNPSVSQEAELELADAARRYADDGGKDLGLALIDEFERALQLLCEQPALGAEWGKRRRLPLRRPQLFTLNGALSVTCRLSPSVFLASVN